MRLTVERLARMMDLSAVRTDVDAAQVKAAGGVRDLATVAEMLRLGVTRFGVGVASGEILLEACAAQESVR